MEYGDHPKTVEQAVEVGLRASRSLINQLAITREERLDMEQEVRIKCFEVFTKYGSSDTISGLIAKAANNIVRDFARAEARKHRNIVHDPTLLFEIVGGDYETAEDIVTRLTDEQAAEAALKVLDPKYRAGAAYIALGWTQEEAADMTGVSRGGLHSALQRAGEKTLRRAA